MVTSPAREVITTSPKRLTKGTASSLHGRGPHEEIHHFAIARIRAGPLSRCEPAAVTARLSAELL